MIREYLNLNIYSLCLYFYIFSFLGWVMETCLCSYNEKNYVNRGFLNGPVCPIYGVGMCLIIIFLTGLKEHLPLLFAGGFVFATTLEYFVGYMLEKLFNAKWWDYSHKRHNLHGRICIEISMCWGILSVIMVRFIVPAIDILIAKIDMLWGWIAIGSFSVLLLADTVITVYNMYGLNRILDELAKIKDEIQVQFNSTEELIKSKAENYKLHLNEITDTDFESYKIIIEKWKLRMEELFAEDPAKESRLKELSENMSNLKNKYKEQIKRPNRVHKRLLRAYPNLRTNKNNISLQEIRQDIMEKIKSKINKES